MLLNNIYIICCVQRDYFYTADVKVLNKAPTWMNNYYYEDISKINPYYTKLVMYDVEHGFNNGNKQWSSINFSRNYMYKVELVFN